MDIVIEPWIAAVLQRGLLEYSDGLLDSGQSIKADIYIREYSASTTKSKKELWTQHPSPMIVRKEIKLINAFPIKRNQIEYKYDQSSAGVFVNDIVNFYFDEYSIKYYDN